jgi:adenosylcobinamide-phosphate synthase
LITLDHVWMLALALVVDAVVGDAEFIWKRIPHPVAATGSLIAFLDRSLNRGEFSAEGRRLAGIVAIIVLVVLAGAVGWVMEALFAALPYGSIGTVIVAAILLAGRSLYDHVATVAAALRTGTLPSARAAVRHIVGRDVDDLDAAGVSRAAIETLAESFSDGVIAPALWFLVLGLPGMLAYKAINTADSMIGHLTERHAHFGWAAARLDDLVNLPASRLSGLLLALAAPLAGGRIGPSLRTMIDDARKHISPNAGWPEAAMAGALRLALGGERSYDGGVVDGATFNAGGRRDASEWDIRRGLRVYLGAAAIFTAVVALAALVVLLT